ncbi:MAG: hypothetical protein AAF358_11550 [Pseudomonadota bacterium]
MNNLNLVNLRSRIGLSLLGCSLLVSSSLADDGDVPPILPEACEVSLAKSAAPDYLQDDVTVFVLTRDGYEQRITGSSNFSCIVNRDHPNVLKPTCFDAEGSATIIPKIKYFGSQLLLGKSVAEINNDVAQRFDAGEFHEVRRPGVAYMLSKYNRPVNGQTGLLAWFPPHVMFYAPNLTNEDIGHDHARNTRGLRLPMIGYQGPHGYMIVTVGDDSERSRSDLVGCPDWVHDDNHRVFTPEPKS